MDTEKYKILIADDEYWTREKLRRMIQWEKYGLVFLEPASDGEEVLRKMEEYHPDIVITDINMPYMDGVTLLQRLSREYPEVITFVISGYDDFEYVRESFLAGSIHYLMKPVSQIDLITAVSKALELISKRKQEKEEILKAASFLEDREFSQLLERKASPLVPGITINGSLDYAGMTLVLLKIHDLKKLSAEYGYDMNRLSFAMKQKLSGWLGEKGAIVFNHVYRSNEFILVSEKETQELRALFQRIVTVLEQEAQSPVTAVFSDHSFSLDSLHQAYVQTVSLLMSRSYAPVSQVIFPEGKNSGAGEITNRFSERQKSELAELLRKGLLKEAEEYIFYRIGLADCQKERWQYLEVRQTVKRITLFLMEYFASWPQLAGGLEDMDQILDKELELLDASRVCEMLKDFMDSCMVPVQPEGADTIRGAVYQAADYIRQHYCEPLTLGMLAQRFHVESSYFSRCFSKEMGVSLLQYIARIRIEKAKEYIARGNTNLTEIAFTVGYDDYTYFNKVFRKLEGMSPREYRAQIGSSSK